MTKDESLHLKRLKMEMLTTIPEVLKLSNLQERERLILADILSDMVNERTPYKKRFAAFSLRQYVVDEIRQKYSQPLNTSPVVGQFFNPPQTSNYWKEQPF